MALKVPFFHSNIDFDEVLFYHSGDFFSRAGISPGMLTFHPQGIHHGPQRAAFERKQQQAAAHREAVERRNADAAKSGKPAAPLPAPDASAR